FPAESFFMHAKLLEVAACLSDEYGGGSLTALPIIQTEQGDISDYISTNVISITDGQIYMVKRHMNSRINVELSVSRIGNAAQN
ncbi:F0F1 ATP synthase subunit alpha, partial [Escherichia coli]|nr:F0F1 ATP synthase subunit alpha [Escherichia coli]